jgi:hypothetical protein
MMYNQGRGSVCPQGGMGEVTGGADMGMERDTNCVLCWRGTMPSCLLSLGILLSQLTHFL